ncbi:MAG: hypothetical protein ACR2NR_01595 [Solirubrobacteraceae bacterium]
MQWRAQPALAGDRRFVHAFPSVENAASNAVCRSAGFALLGPIEAEYPPGTTRRATIGRST